MSNPQSTDPTYVVVDRKSRLDLIYRKYRRDPAFTKLRNPFPNQRERNFVPGEGNECPLVMFVGEAPGAVENAKKRPFVGTAGHELDNWLVHGQLSRMDCWITNVVKYQPPRNRTPFQTERDASKWYLAAEVTILQPPVIALLGNVALRTVFGDELSIGDCHGRVMERKGRAYVPLWHPMAVIYDPDKRQSALDDIMALMTEVVRRMNS